MPLSGITAVRPTADTGFRNVLYGATIAAGQTLYTDASDGKHKLADANLSTAAALARGIAITPGVDTSYGIMAVSGSVILVGTTMVVGEQYYVGSTAGQMIASSELATGDRVTLLGVAASATQLNLDIRAFGITRA